MSRSPKLTFTLLEDYFNRLDVGLVSVTEGFDTSTKEGRMPASVAPDCGVQLKL